MSELWDGADYRSAEQLRRTPASVRGWRRRHHRRNHMLDNNRTFTKLATTFDHRLQDYRDAEQLVADANARLTSSAEAMRVARDELLEAYPELAPAKPDNVLTPAGEWQPPGPGAFTPIEVDDADDVPDFSERR